MGCSLPDWRGVAIVAKLSQPQSCSTLVSEIPGITPENAKQFLSLLLATQMLSQETYKEVENATLAQWDFHDLLFHTRSR